MSDMNEEMQILFDNYTALMDGGQYLQLKQELNEEQPANIAEYFEELTAEKQLYLPSALEGCCGRGVLLYG